MAALVFQHTTAAPQEQGFSHFHQSQTSLQTRINRRATLSEGPIQCIASRRPLELDVCPYQNALPELPPGRRDPALTPRPRIVYRCGGSTMLSLPFTLAEPQTFALWE